MVCLQWLHGYTLHGVMLICFRGTGGMPSMASCCCSSWYNVDLFQRNWWHAFNGFMVLLFMAAFFARVTAIVHCLHAYYRDKPEAGLYDSKYAKEPRVMWKWNDPMLISEAFFCVGSVLAFARILWMFQVRERSTNRRGKSRRPLRRDGVATYIILTFLFKRINRR